MMPKKVPIRTNDGQLLEVSRQIQLQRPSFLVIPATRSSLASQMSGRWHLLQSICMFYGRQVLW